MTMRIPGRGAPRLAAAAAVLAGAALAVVSAAVGAGAQQQNFDAVQIDALKVRDNIYMLVGAGGNTTIQFGSEGVMVVDTSFAPMSTKLLKVGRCPAPPREETLRS